MISSLVAKIAALAAILSVIQGATALDLANDTVSLGYATKALTPC